MIRSARDTTTPAQAPAFTRCIVLVNPVSTHANQVDRRVAALRKAFPGKDVRILHTLPEGRTANQQLLAKHAKLLGPHTLLCIGGGDGTVNMAVEALITHPAMPAAARHTSILPLWGGNANDLAHMLNGAPFRTKVKDLFERGRIVPIHPLECMLMHKDGRREKRIAVCYASFGATAFAAHRISEPSHRKHLLHHLPGGRFLLELITVLSAFLDAPTFRVEEKGRPKFIYERTFANGSRFAKIDRLPIRLTDNMFYLHTLEDKKWLSALPSIVEITQKRMAEKFLRDRASFTTREPTLAQFDGETVDIPAGTRVRVRLSQQPFYALSTLLQ
jgi:diacylglycerol kinase family enzyme